MRLWIINKDFAACLIHHIIIDFAYLKRSRAGKGHAARQSSSMCLSYQDRQTQKKPPEWL